MASGNLNGSWPVEPLLALMGIESKVLRLCAEPADVVVVLEAGLISVNLSLDVEDDAVELLEDETLVADTVELDSPDDAGAATANAARPRRTAEVNWLCIIAV